MSSLGSGHAGDAVSSMRPGVNEGGTPRSHFAASGPMGPAVDTETGSSADPGAQVSFRSFQFARTRISR